MTWPNRFHAWFGFDTVGLGLGQYSISVVRTCWSYATVLLLIVSFSGTGWMNVNPYFPPACLYMKRYSSVLSDWAKHLHLTPPCLLLLVADLPPVMSLKYYVYFGHNNYQFFYLTSKLVLLTVSLVIHLILHLFIISLNIIVQG